MAYKYLNDDGLKAYTKKVKGALKDLHTSITTALASYVAKSDIVDTTGSAADKVMSQHGVTESINGVNDKVTELERESGLLNSELFELGNITISGSGWSYGASETRVRTKKGSTIHLSIGDYIEMPSSCRYYLGWLTPNGEYHYKGWLQNKFEIAEEGDYVLLMRQEPEVTIESVDSILGLLKCNFGIRGDIDTLSAKSNELENNLSELYHYIAINHFKNENAAIYNGKYNIQTSDFRYARWFDVSSSNGKKLKISCGIGSSYPYAFFDSYDIVNNSIPFALGGENSQIVKDAEITIPDGAKVLVAVGGKDETSVSVEISSPKTEGVINIFNSPSSVITAIHGGTTSYPANTLGLYKQAFHNHILYWECDVRPCADGYVLCHDDDIYNHAVNSDGSTISQGSVLISNKTIEELKQYKFGVITNKQSEGVVEGFENETIPTLEEFLLLAKALGATPMIEIKFWATELQVKDIMDIIKRYAMLDNAIIIGYTQVSNTIKWAIKYGAKNVELIINDGSGSDSDVDTAYAIVENDMSKLNKVIFAPMKSQFTQQTCIYASTKGMICGVWTIVGSETTSKIMELFANGTTLFTSDILNVSKIIKQQYLM